MTGESDGKAPSAWIRVLGIIGAAFLVVYGTIGVLRNDLHVSLSKSSSAGVHLHGPLAWLCFAGLMMMSIGMVGLLAPEFGDGEFNFAARRRRFGPILAVGLAFYVASQVIAGLRSWMSARWARAVSPDDRAFLARQFELMPTFCLDGFVRDTDLPDLWERAKK
jgi:Na+-driven multidrug efflux pump